MSVLTVNYIKKNSILSFDTNTKPTVSRYDQNGEEIDSSPYVKQAFSQTMSGVRPPFDQKRGQFYINLPINTPEDRERLNQYVKECGLVYDKNHPKSGQVIEETNPRNIRDPFFTNEEFQLRFESGQSVINDETPLGFLISKWVEADPRFMVNGEELNPLISAKVVYMVSKGGEVDRMQEKSADETVTAVTLLGKMDFERQKQVARAMGIALRNPDPGKLRTLLLTKITSDKDKLAKDGKGTRNIDTFLKYAQAPSSELKTREVVTQARAEKIILRKTGNKYYYEDILLGSNLDQVNEFLNNHEDILDAIISKIDRL